MPFLSGLSFYLTVSGSRGSRDVGSVIEGQLVVEVHVKKEWEWEAVGSRAHQIEREYFYK